MTSVVPFGKYKGQPVEVLLADSAYVEWARAQQSLVDRYKTLWALVDSLQGSNTVKTPEHNALQAELFDEPLKVITAVGLPIYKAVKYKTRVIAEPFIPKAGYADLLIEVEATCPMPWVSRFPWRCGEYDYASPEFVSDLSYPALVIECKPQIGDDYPQVLRQASNYVRAAADSKVVVICRSYAGQQPLEQVQRMFRSRGVCLVVLQA